MAEEKKPSKAAEFFFKHGEKVVLAACALALVAYLILGIAMAKEDTSARDLKKAGDKVGIEMNKAHDDMKAPEAKTWGPEARQPWDKVISVETTKNDWVGALATEIKHKPYKKIEIPKRGVKHPSVAMGATAVALDGVAVQWSATGFTMAEMAKEKAATDFLKISHFVVEREVAGSGKWEVLAEKVPAPEPPKGSRDMPPINMTYRDARIEPKTKYNYRVTAFLDAVELGKLDPKKVNLSGIAAGGKLETVATDSPAATLGIWKLRFVNMMKGQAYIEIEKFDKQHGKVKIAHIHYAGDKIGWWKKDPQDDKEEPTPIHRVTVGGKGYDVDFNTGMTLKSVESKKVTVEVPKCTRKFEGTLEIPHEPVVEKVQVETIEVLYTDEDGKDQTLYHPEPKQHPLALPKTCADHGGRKAVEPPKEGPKKEEPKEDPKVAAARAREAEAEKIFLDADKAEQKGDKKAAIAGYEKLLKDFAATDFVAKGKKAILEEKIRKLKVP